MANFKDYLKYGIKTWKEKNDGYLEFYCSIEVSYDEHKLGAVFFNITGEKELDSFYVYADDFAKYFSLSDDDIYELGAEHMRSLGYIVD